MILGRKFVEGNDEIGSRNVLWTQLPQRFGGGIYPVLGQMVEKFGCDVLLRRNSAGGDVYCNMPFCCAALEKFARDRALNSAKLTNEKNVRRPARHGSTDERRSESENDRSGK